MAENVGTTRTTGWTGWVYFAGVLMILSGVLQSIEGLTALLNDQFFVSVNGRIAVFDITTWGWIHLIMGIVMLMAGNAVFSGRTWGRWVGIFLASLNFVASFAFVSEYPIWSITAMILNIIFIYALTVHGDAANA